MLDDEQVSICSLGCLKGILINGCVTSPLNCFLNRNVCLFSFRETASGFWRVHLPASSCSSPMAQQTVGGDSYLSGYGAKDTSEPQETIFVSLNLCI